MFKKALNALADWTYRPQQSTIDYENALRQKQCASNWSQWQQLQNQYQQMLQPGVPAGMGGMGGGLWGQMGTIGGGPHPAESFGFDLADLAIQEALRRMARYKGLADMKKQWKEIMFRGRGVQPDPYAGSPSQYIPYSTGDTLDYGSWTMTTTNRTETE